MDSQLDCIENESNWRSPSSLLPTNDGDNPSDKAFSDRTSFNNSSNDSNSAANPGSYPSASDPLQGAQYIQQALFSIQAQREAFQEASRLTHAQHQQIKSEAAERRQIDRMQKFLASGDPILVAEAMAWAQVNPGVLDASQSQLYLLTNLQSESNRSSD